MGLTWGRHWGLLTCRRGCDLRKGSDLFTHYQGGHPGLAEQINGIKGRTFPKSHHLGRVSIPEDVQASKPTRGRKTNMLLMSRKIISQPLKSVFVPGPPQLRFS